MDTTIIVPATVAQEDNRRTHEDAFADVDSTSTRVVNKKEKSSFGRVVRANAAVLAPSETTQSILFRQIDVPSILVDGKLIHENFVLRKKTDELIKFRDEVLQKKYASIFEKLGAVWMRPDLSLPGQQITQEIYCNGEMVSSVTHSCEFVLNSKSDRAHLMYAIIYADLLYGPILEKFFFKTAAYPKNKNNTLQVDDLMAINSFVDGFNADYGLPPLPTFSVAYMNSKNHTMNRRFCNSVMNALYGFTYSFRHLLYHFSPLTEEEQRTLQTLMGQTMLLFRIFEEALDKLVDSLKKKDLGVSPLFLAPKEGEFLVDIKDVLLTEEESLAGAIVNQFPSGTLDESDAEEEKENDDE